MTPTRVGGIAANLAARALGATWLALIGAGSLQGQTPLTVGANVQVTKNRPNDTYGEVWLSSHPSDPDRLLACAVHYKPGSNARGTVLYLSIDAGKSWSQVFDTDSLADNADPACGFGPDNLAIHNILVLDENLPGRFGIFSYRSTDGGLTWSRSANLSSAGGTLDRQSVTIDTSSGSKYRGRVYIDGTSDSRELEDNSGQSGMAVYVSVDGGKTYLAPVKRHSNKGYVLGVGNGAVLSDGTYLALFGVLREYTPSRVTAPGPDRPNADLTVVTSTDGGESFSPIVKVSDWHMGHWTENSPYACCSPTLASDPGSSAFKDRVYATWVDIRGGRSRIHLAWSANKGKNWSAPLIVSDDTAATDLRHGPDNIMPTVAVNRNGVVGVSWYHVPNRQADPGWEIRFAASFDGGETFGKSVRVSEASARYDLRASLYAAAFVTNAKQPDTLAPSSPISVNVGAQGRQFYGGDYAGLSADSRGVFHAAWVDNRTGYSQIWSAPIATNGTAIRNGSTDLADLADLSAQVKLTVAGVAVDRVKGELTATATITNNSKETIRGPLKVRVIALSSQLGVPTVVGSTNAESGPGAVLDFSETIPVGGLPPGAASTARSLRFRLTSPRPIWQHDDFRYQLLALEVRVLGRRR